MTRAERIKAIILRGRKGVTMIELMVTIVILAIGIIPIALVQTRSNRDVFVSGQRTEALQVAHDQMERIRNMGFANAVSDSGTVAGVYNWRATVQPAGTGLNSITVQVQWQEGAQQRQLELNNLLSMR